MLNKLTISILFFIITCLFISCVESDKSKLINLVNSLDVIDSTDTLYKKYDNKVLIAYLNGNCHICVKNVELLNKIANKNTELNFTLVLIFHTYDIQAFEKLLKPELSLHFPSYIDQNNLISNEYSLDVDKAPNHYLLIKDNVIIYHTYSVDKKLIGLINM